MSTENQNNVVEVGNVPENKQTEKPKTEWEKMLEDMMRRAYLNGLSTGMKTMCGSVLEKMNQFHNQRMNPQMQLIQLRQWCNNCLGKVNAQHQTETKQEENKTEE